MAVRIKNHRLCFSAENDQYRKYHNIPRYSLLVTPKFCISIVFSLFWLPRETEDNTYAKFWSDQQRVLWYVMVFSGVVNYVLVPLCKIGSENVTEFSARDLHAV